MGGTEYTQVVYIYDVSDNIATSSETKAVILANSLRPSDAYMRQ